MTTKNIDKQLIQDQSYLNVWKCWATYDNK